VLAGDGQVTFGQTVVKQSAKKIRRLYNDRILAGFAGSAADSFAPVRALRSQAGAVPRQPGALGRGAREGLAHRSHPAPLEAMLIVLDKTSTFLLSGNGDLIEPDDGIVAIGSGGPYALAAAQGAAANTELDARAIAESAMRSRDLHLNQHGRSREDVVAIYLPKPPDVAER
jgi:ATP-dependent HslUV protease subunit HslV